MTNHPYQREPGLLYAPVVTDPPAGLRSLISELHGHVPPRLGRWAIPIRLAVSAVCFTGGSVCAWVFAKCLLDPGACPCLMPPLPSLPVLAIALLPLCAPLLPALATTVSNLLHAGSAWVPPGVRHALPVYATDFTDG